jgi:hypothetical protein
MHIKREASMNPCPSVKGMWIIILSSDDEYDLLGMLGLKIIVVQLCKKKYYLGCPSVPSHCRLLCFSST